MDPIVISLSEALVPVIAIISLFVVMPALIFHYILQLRKARSLSEKDEQTIDDMYALAQRLEDRVRTIERIMDADSPGWRQGGRTREEDTHV